MKTADSIYDLSDGHMERYPKQDEKTGAVYWGEMDCDALKLPFFLVPAKKHKDASPDFQIFAYGRSGNASPFGVAWKNEDRTGAIYFSMQFQHAKALPNGLMFNAWPDDEQPKDAQPGDDPAFFSIKWSRPPRGARRAEKAADDFAGMVGAGI